MACMPICVNILPENSMQEVTVVLNNLSEHLTLEAVMEEDWMLKEISMPARIAQPWLRPRDHQGLLNGIPNVGAHRPLPATMR